MPENLKAEQWYERTDGARYRFYAQGATFEMPLPSADIAPEACTRYLFKEDSGDYFFVDANGRSTGYEFDADPTIESKLHAIGIQTAPSIVNCVRPDAEAFLSKSVAKTGDVVTILKNAAVESTENTVSVAWSGGSPSLLKAFGAVSDNERLRVEDDGLRLVRLSDPSVSYVLR